MLSRPREDLACFRRNDQGGLGRYLLAFSPGGDELLCGDSIVTLASGATRAAPASLVEPDTTFPAAHPEMYFWDGGGLHVVSVRDDDHFNDVAYFFDPRSVTTEEIARSPNAPRSSSSYRTFAMSPDGAKIAFLTTYCGDVGFTRCLESELTYLNVLALDHVRAGTMAVQGTTDLVSYPIAFSHDGKKLAYFVFRRLYVSDAHP